LRGNLESLQDKSGSKKSEKYGDEERLQDVREGASVNYDTRRRGAGLRIFCRFRYDGPCVDGCHSSDLTALQKSFERQPCGSLLCFLFARAFGCRQFTAFVPDFDFESFPV